MSPETQSRDIPTFERLWIIDPDLTQTILAILREKNAPIPDQEMEMLENETLWGLGQDIILGRSLAKGYARLIGEVPPRRLEIYQNAVRSACRKGLNLGWLMAVHWVPVLKFGDEDLIHRFSNVIRVMGRQGEYPLKKPLEMLTDFLEKGRLNIGRAFLGLLFETFSQDLSYKETLHLSRFLTERVNALKPSCQIWQIPQIQRVAQADARLAEPFVSALEKELNLLSQTGLHIFVTRGLESFQRDERLGRKFLSLESRLGMDAWQSLLVTVPLSHVRGRLNPYLKARTGLGVVVRPVSDVPAIFWNGEEETPLVSSDGKYIYLADEISIFEHKEENLNLYRCLTKLESAYYEFGTFDFDLERAASQFGFPMPENRDPGLSDMEIFFRMFPLPSLAADVFTLFEQGRIRAALTRHYPGMVRETLPLIRAEAAACKGADHRIWPLFLKIALGDDPSLSAPFDLISNQFDKTIDAQSPVEACAGLVFRTYDILLKLCGNKDGGWRPIHFPFGRRIRPDLFHAAFERFEQISRQIHRWAAGKGLRIYAADVRNYLIQNRGNLLAEDIRAMIIRPENTGQGPMDFSDLDLSEILCPISDNDLPDSSPYPAFWYREWDIGLGDYLHDHARVLDRTVSAVSGDFYEKTLQTHYGLASSVRRAFEMIRPEGMAILRQWVEGDEFDYRALLDFFLDKKAGIMPSDRLYIKRIKQHREVAVLLLVDLSRSTANRVFGSQERVLDVEKTAIVLFCEALQAVGDDFAIAGFSGTGRLSVDYFRIKDFDEPVSDAVKNRINSMAPQRSTRMGAALRHASAQIEKAAARARILILLSDGFPNDTGYKREYAITDTRKAIAEARSKNIHCRAITVNIRGDDRLDDLYGAFHHNVISDVRELPEKLLRIYSSLTR
jgi:Mg-chelatase subunit ChlD